MSAAWESVSPRRSAASGHLTPRNGRRRKAGRSARQGDSHALTIRVGQARREQANRGQPQRAVGEPLEDEWKLPRRRRRVDAIVGRAFTEVQFVAS